MMVFVGELASCKILSKKNLAPKNYAKNHPLIPSNLPRMDVVQGKNQLDKDSHDFPFLPKISHELGVDLLL